MDAALEVWLTDTQHYGVVASVDGVFKYKVLTAEWCLESSYGDGSDASLYCRILCGCFKIERSSLLMEMSFINVYHTRIASSVKYGLKKSNFLQYILTLHYRQLLVRCRLAI